MNTSLTQKITYRVIPFIGCFGKGKTVETEFRSVVARGWDEGKRLPTKGYEGTFWNDGNTLSQL